MRATDPTRDTIAAVEAAFAALERAVAARDEAAVRATLSTLVAEYKPAPAAEQANAERAAAE